MLLKPRKQMALNAGAFLVLDILVCSVIAAFSDGYGAQSDASCLISIKESLEDPHSRLASWTFNNLTEGALCQYVGVSCGGLSENMVSSIRLHNMGLKGEFPRGVENCGELLNLDLSGNDLAGSIPHDIGESVVLVKMLDLSNNGFSGNIPSSIGSCSDLQILKLENNRLTGQIPPQLSHLAGLIVFSVANNLLSGPVPDLVGISISADSYANNIKLCGGPLGVCKKHEWNYEPSFKSGFVVGFVVNALIYTTIFMSYFKPSVGSKKKMTQMKMTKLTARRKNKSKETQLPTQLPTQQLRCKWSKELFVCDGIIKNMDFDQLSEATNNFGEQNIIGQGKRGTMYQAMLPDGTFLAVKRFDVPWRFENQFTSELILLSKLMHVNFVPLLGFCREMQEGILIYKYMSNGNLQDRLEAVRERATSLEWPLRVKIAVGVARGLAWIHHQCNLRTQLHLEISSNRILLDQNFEPIISRFGGLMFMNSDEIDSSENFSGELQLLKKDLYSFGVVLLELVTGKAHVSDVADSLEGTLVQRNNHVSTISPVVYNLIDKSLMGKGYDHEIFDFLGVACDCLRPFPDLRLTLVEVYKSLSVAGKRHDLETVK